jgi:8-amino-7-oxononanoate synthase
MLASALKASLRVIEHDDARRERLHRNIALLRRRVAGAIAGTGWELGESATAIQPVVIGSNEQALAVAEGLASRGIWVPAIRPPTVPEGTARLRIAVSAAHTAADIDSLANALGAIVSQHPH